MPVTDFDFLPGRWRIANRRITNRLDPECDEWETFEAAYEARAILQGGGNIDHFRIGDFEGFTLRLYDPSRDVWRIWWADTARPGRLDPPVEGRFTAGRGRFEGDDVLEGVPIRVRLDWLDITERSVRWEQAFSFDDGRTWKTNWIMEFTREPDSA